MTIIVNNTASNISNINMESSSAMENNPRKHQHASISSPLSTPIGHSTSQSSSSSSAQTVTPCQSIFRSESERAEETKELRGENLHVISFSSSDEDDEIMATNNPLDYRLDWTRTVTNSLRDLCKSLHYETSESDDMMDCDSVHSFDMDSVQGDDEWRRESMSNFTEDDEVLW